MRAPLVALLMATAVTAQAFDEDSAALSLGGEAFSTVPEISNWRIFSEAAWSESRLRAGGSRLIGRLSIDLNYDKSFANGCRAVVANRLDARWQDNPTDQRNVNTLKEAYLSWQSTRNRIVDFGRINTRFGVAYGYNPTDYFRSGAVRSIVSVEPSSLRENRLGSVMLRAQTLWPKGSLTAIYSPKLANGPSDSEFSADLGATNRRDRWLLAGSLEFADDLNPQWLLYGGAVESPQLGLNLTSLLNDATVAHFEWSGGRSESLLSQALARDEGEAFRSRLATGITYTTPNNLSITLEYQYNGAGLDQNGWDTLRRGPLADYGRYRNFVTDRGDSPTKQRIFLRASYENAFLRNLDLSSNVFFDAVDSSHLVWIEARYHWSRVDLALSSQVSGGQARSNYGALPERRVWQVLVRFYF